MAKHPLICKTTRHQLSFPFSQHPSRNHFQNPCAKKVFQFYNNLCGIRQNTHALMLNYKFISGRFAAPRKQANLCANSASARNPREHTSGRDSGTAAGAGQALSIGGMQIVRWRCDNIDHGGPSPPNLGQFPHLFALPTQPVRN